MYIIKTRYPSKSIEGSKYHDQTSNLLLRCECMAWLATILRELCGRYQSVRHIFPSFRAPEINYKRHSQPHVLQIWSIILPCGFVIIVDSRCNRVDKGKTKFICVDAPECCAQRSA